MAVPDRTEPAGRGGPGPDRDAPGWYRDPGEGGQLRYWDGTTWTSRRRPTPVWTDGGMAGAALAPAVPRRASSRRRWLVLVVVAVAGTTAVGIAGQAMRPKSPGTRLLTDARYVRLANAECVKTLADLRPQDSGPFGQAIAPAQTAAQIDRAAAGLDSLADRLRTLPASASDRSHIDRWLDGWHRYTGLGRQYAVFLRQHGNAQPGSVLVNSVHEASVADRFALANGLGSCTLFATPQPDPANGF